MTRSDLGQSKFKDSCAAEPEGFRVPALCRWTPLPCQTKPRMSLCPHYCNPDKCTNCSHLTNRVGRLRSFN